MSIGDPPTPTWKNGKNNQHRSIELRASVVFARNQAILKTSTICSLSTGSQEASIMALGCFVFSAA